MESYKGFKKTNLKTCVFGETRIVYECIAEGKYKGKLFYRWRGFWAGTFKEYCFEARDPR